MFYKKKYLEKLYRQRTYSDRDIKKNYLLLDRNEKFIPLDPKLKRQLIKKLSKINPGLYPDISPFYKKISRKNARRSIVTTKKIEKDTVLKRELITYKRPGTGISPLYWDKVIGKKVVNDLDDDHILQWSDIETSKNSN